MYDTDTDTDTCAYCAHSVSSHRRSGCLDCACIEYPQPWDPSDD